MQSLRKLSMTFGRGSPVNNVQAINFRLTPRSGQGRPSPVAASGCRTETPHKSPRIQLLKRLMSGDKWSPEHQRPHQRRLVLDDGDGLSAATLAEGQDGGFKKVDTVGDVKALPTTDDSGGSSCKDHRGQAAYDSLPVTSQVATDGARLQDGCCSKMVASPKVGITQSGKVRRSPSSPKYNPVNGAGRPASPRASADANFSREQPLVAEGRLRRRLFVTSTKHLSPPPDVATVPAPDDHVRHDDEESQSLASPSPAFAYSEWLPETLGAREAVALDTPLRHRIQQSGLEVLPDLPKVLGRGGFGVVVLGCYRDRQVALKIVSRSTKLLHQVEASLRGERNALYLRPHPHIVRTLLVSRARPTDRFALVVMEMAGGRHLAAILDNPAQAVDRRRRLRFAQQMSLAVQWCHEHHVAHLDVKPANVIVSVHDTCKLADFGCSVKLSQLQVQQQSGVGGTASYRAPELFYACRPSISADVYSLGVSLWQLLSRRSPYPGWDPHTIIYKVGAGNERPLSGSDVRVDEADYVDLYEAMWRREVSGRPRIEEVVTRIEMMTSCF